MNASNAFAENATSTLESESSNGSKPTPFTNEDMVKRRTRRRIMERFEQAFFVGLLLTLLLFAGYIGFSEYSTPTAMAASEPTSLLMPDENVRVTWEDEPAFELPAVPQMGDSESYPVVGEAVETTWIASEAGAEGVESSPYVKEKSTSVDVLEPVPAPAALDAETESAIATEMERPVGGVPMDASLGNDDIKLVVETTPGSEEVAVVESLAQALTDSSARVGVLRVGGGHAGDLKRLYTDPAVVYGLE